MQTIARRFSRADLEMLYDRIHSLYRERGASRRVPILSAGGETVAGYPLSPSRLRAIDPVMPPGTVMAVDAGAKVLFDGGAFKIVEAKVAVGAWRRTRRVYGPRPVKRIGVFADKHEVADWLFQVELEEALRAYRVLRPSILLLDRPLSAPSPASPTTRGLLARISEAVDRDEGVLVGLVKRSGLRLSTGEGLLGTVAMMAKAVLPGVPWVYHPVFPRHRLPPWAYGDVSVVLLSGRGDSVFRMDVSLFTVAREEVSEVAGLVAGLADESLPGYPYPLKAVHNEARIGEAELELDRTALLEELGRMGLLGRFRADLMAGGFKERHLW